MADFFLSFCVVLRSRCRLFHCTSCVELYHIDVFVGARFDSELENYPYIGNNDKNDQVRVLLKMALHGS